MDSLRDGWLDSWLNARIERRMDGWMDEWVGGWLMVELWIAERGKSGGCWSGRKEGWNWNKEAGDTERKMKRSESKALFSFHDIQCQIELNNLFFSVSLCFSLASLSLMLHTETHNMYAYYYPTHTKKHEECTNSGKKRRACRETHTTTVYLCI